MSGGMRGGVVAGAVELGMRGEVVVATSVVVAVVAVGAVVAVATSVVVAVVAVVDGAEASTHNSRHGRGWAMRISPRSPDVILPAPSSECRANPFRPLFR